MARYVLLEFDDNKDADAFVTSLGRGTVLLSHKTGADEGAYGYLDTRNVRARAVWAKPTQFCDCSPDKGVPPRNESEYILSRGKKWGWLIHATCGKPRPGWCHHPRNLLFPPPEESGGLGELYLGVWEPLSDDVSMSPFERKRVERRNLRRTP